MCCKLEPGEKSMLQVSWSSVNWSFETQSPSHCNCRHKPDHNWQQPPFLHAGFPWQCSSERSGGLGGCLSQWGMHMDGNYQRIWGAPACKAAWEMNTCSQSNVHLFWPFVSQLLRLWSGLCVCLFLSLCLPFHNSCTCLYVPSIIIIMTIYSKFIECNTVYNP